LGPTYLNEDCDTNDNESYWGPSLFVDAKPTDETLRLKLGYEW
jgi:hypothetical protein